MLKKNRHIDAVFYNFNPFIKLILILFLVCLVFLANNFLANVATFSLIIILWFSIKPAWKHTKIIAYSIIFIFTLILIINWAVVKSPTVIIFENSWYNWWGKTSGTFEQYDNTDNFKFFIAKMWGITYDGSPAFKIGGNYREAYDYFRSLHSNGYQISISSVYYHGQTIWMGFGYSSAWYALSSQTLVYAFLITVKISSMIILISLLTITTTNVQLSYAFYLLLFPLKLFRAPVKEWSVILSLSFRFVPTLVSEAQRIMNAQASRGVDFSNGNILDKVKSLTSLIIPVFTIGFLKSIDLSNAMEARGFITNATTTKYRQYKITKSSLIIFSLLCVVMGFITVLISTNTLLGSISMFELEIISK
ncbi:MAG: energy-coupling factor transporter transmembrane protein EcfT [Mycoplasmataceae bacterium]|nr:energy-coupling factor transporter transmembrane protein EcfT [Mycoplasmataceae bacterium]